MPKLDNGSVDWETVFESPDTGLISLIHQAQSAQALERCTNLVVETLFNRSGDAERRVAFSAVVGDIMDFAGQGQGAQARDASLYDVKSRVTQVLRCIKDDRQQRARQVMAMLDKTSGTGEAEVSARDLRSADPEIAASTDFASKEEAMEWALSGREVETPDAPVEKPAAAQSDTKSVKLTETELVCGRFPSDSAEAYFVNVICSSVLERLSILRGVLSDPGPLDGQLPFILSPAFAERFSLFLRNHVLGHYTDSCMKIVNRMASHPADQWSSFLNEAMESRSDRLILWERWQAAWLETTTQRELPPRPSFVIQDTKKKGLRGKMARVTEKNSARDKEFEDLSIGGWEDAVSIIESENEHAADVWAWLIDTDQECIAPTDGDNKLLMELFGRSVDGMAKQVEAIVQIAGQGAEPGKAFDAYQRGKHLDLPLLAASYRFPDALLMGKRPKLSVFVGGYDKRRLQETLPLSYRFLSKYMK